MAKPDVLVRGVEPSADVTSILFREGMSRLGAAVSIVCTDAPAGRAGFTALAVCSRNDTPPMLLACLHHHASVYPRFRGNSTLCVNVLTAGHEELSNIFGGGRPRKNALPTRKSIFGLHRVGRI